MFAQVIEFFSSPSVTWDTPFVGGETFRQVHGRVMAFLGSLLARPSWTTALAVAHGGANTALLAGVLGLPEGEIPRIEQDLGCINAIDFDATGRPTLRLLNFSAHDPLKAIQREPSAVHLRRAFEERGWTAPQAAPSPATKTIEPSIPGPRIAKAGEPALALPRPSDGVRGHGGAQRATGRARAPHGPPE